MSLKSFHQYGSPKHGLLTLLTVKISTENDMWEYQQFFQIFYSYYITCLFNHKRLIIKAHLCFMIPNVHLMHISIESVCVCLWLCPLGSSDNTWWHTLGMIAVKQGNKTWIASTVAIVTPQPLTLQQQPVPGRWGRVYFFIVPRWVSHTKHVSRRHVFCERQSDFLHPLCL